MRIFKITNPKYTGEVSVLYKEQLLKIDFSNATIDDYILAGFKKAVPSTLQEFLIGKWCTDVTRIIEGTFEVSLEDFKRDYPYQRNSHLLPPIWDKMDVADKLKAVEEAKPYRKYCEKNKHWYNPKIAAAWLKNKEYLNDWSKM